MTAEILNYISKTFPLLIKEADFFISLIFMKNIEHEAFFSFESIYVIDFYTIFCCELRTIGGVFRIHIQPS